jgi:DHA1 family bicyclomycin/chloramphenicol resistance-like MFS transporter
VTASSDPALFKRTYWLLCLTIGVGPLAVDTSLPAMGDMAADLGLGIGRIQASLSAFVIGVAIGQLSWGTLADRFGRRPMLLIGLGTYVVTALAVASLSSIEFIMIARAIQGFGSAAVFIMSRAVVRDLFDVTTGARMFSRLFQTVGLFAVICPIIGGELTELFGWRAVYVFMASWSVLGMIVITSFLKESLVTPDYHALRLGRIWSSFGELLGDATFRGYLILGASAYIGLFAILAGMPIVVINHLGESPAVFGYLYSAVMVVYLAATMLAERLVRRIGIERMAKWGVVTIALSAILTVAAHAVGMITFITVFVVNAVVMVGFAFTMPATTAGALAKFQHMAGRATSLMGFAHQAVGALAVYLMGLATGGGPHPHTIAMVSAGLVAIGAYIFLLRPLYRKIL